MKKIITICAAILINASVLAQAPEKISYQAVVRDGNNALVTSTAVGMQISILQGSANGTAVYVETQTPTSNANGLVSLEIGSGTVVSGTFVSIDWANGPYFIQTETDPTGGTSYTITGTSQLLSVPYALHSKTAKHVINDSVDDADADPTNEIELPNGGTSGQVLKTDGSGNYSWVNQNTYSGGTNITVSGNTINQNTNMQPFRTINYIICRNGVYPSSSGPGTIEPFIGEIKMFAGAFAPANWSFCDGQLLPISQNNALFAILGTTYGGDGIVTFALPDLRGRAPIHEGQGAGLSNRTLGSSGGTE